MTCQQCGCPISDVYSTYCGTCLDTIENGRYAIATQEPTTTDNERTAMRDLQDQVIEKLIAKGLDDDAPIIGDPFNGTIRLGDLRHIIYPRHAAQFSAFVRETDRRPMRNNWTH